MNQTAPKLVAFIVAGLSICFFVGAAYVIAHFIVKFW